MELNKKIELNKIKFLSNVYHILLPTGAAVEQEGRAGVQAVRQRRGLDAAQPSEDADAPGEFPPEVLRPRRFRPIVPLQRLPPRQRAPGRTGVPHGPRR